MPAPSVFDPVTGGLLLTTSVPTLVYSPTTTATCTATRPTRARTRTEVGNGGTITILPLIYESGDDRWARWSRRPPWPRPRSSWPRKRGAAPHRSARPSACLRSPIFGGYFAVGGTLTARSRAYSAGPIRKRFWRHGRQRQRHRKAGGEGHCQHRRSREFDAYTNYANNPPAQLQGYGVRPYCPDTRANAGNGLTPGRKRRRHQVQ